ncbi:hypothetical protein VSR34_01060 [Paraburkholderia sp. JHI2823]|uniref:hypothetical protein n=1 Tax=Paraburkholderia sp. JHI2823 TaxID=3112960 RepID=UPI00317EC35D
MSHGGPAFPTPEVVLVNGQVRHADATGMTLRDYFAAQMLAGDAANSADDQSWNTDATSEGLEKRARLYYRMADAMIKARGHAD